MPTGDNAHLQNLELHLKRGEGILLLCDSCQSYKTSCLDQELLLVKNARLARLQMIYFPDVHFIFLLVPPIQGLRGMAMTKPPSDVW